MRIDASNQISEIYNTQTMAKTKRTQMSTSRMEQVSISQVGRDYQISKNAVSEASDVREDKVAQLKAMVDNGTYKVDEGDFASKLLAKYNAIL